MSEETVIKNEDLENSQEDLWVRYMGNYCTPEEYLKMDKTLSDLGDDLWDMWSQWAKPSPEDVIPDRAIYPLARMLWLQITHPGDDNYKARDFEPN